MTKLGDICEIVSGTTPKTNCPKYWGGALNWITPAEITETTDVVVDTERKITPLAVKECGLKSLPKGTVLLSSRAPIGKVAIAGVEMFCNQGFKNLICSDRVYNKYLFWFLKSKTDFLNSLGRGATFKEISKSIVEKITIPLPPLATQRRIAAVLDAVGGLIEKRKKQLTKLDELIKSRFVEMFGDVVVNEKGWEVSPLSKLADIKIGPFGSLLHKEDYITNGHALVNPSHIKEGKIVIDSELTISDVKYNELSAYHLNRGDVVLGRRGEMGRCAVVDEDGLLCGTGSLLIRTNGRVTAEFLQKVISFPSFVKTIEDMAVGQTMPNLNVSIVSEFQIPVPPLALQQTFAGFVERVEGLKVKVNESLAELELLKSSLMQKYFGGENETAL